MSGKKIQIKRKPTVLAAKNVTVVSDKKAVAKEPEAPAPRKVMQTGARTARVKMQEIDGELITTTMRVVMEDDDDDPVPPKRANAPASPAPPPVVEEPPPPPRHMTSPREVLGEPTFKFYCYRCGQKLKVPVSWANKMYPCIRCGHDIMIPPPLVGEFW